MTAGRSHSGKFVTMRRALDALSWRDGFGINLDPSHFIPQFRVFVTRIDHVHVKDSLRTLNRIDDGAPPSMEWEDSRTDRGDAGQDALAFARRSEFAPSTVAFDAAFQGHGA